MPDNSTHLQNRTLIVTGASAGIGRALALELSRAGARLVLNARREELLREVAHNCRETGGEADYVAGDIADEEVVARLVDRAVQTGEFNGFIHNAGIARPGPFLWELPIDHFRQVMDTMVTAAYLLVRRAFPELRRRRGGIAVLVGSGAAELTMEGMAAYCTAKAAEEHLARQAAAEAPELTVFAYRPGIVDTNMQKEAREAQGGAAEHLHREFGAYLNQGLLISPEKAATALVRILSRNPRRFHGGVCTWRDGA